MKLILTLSFAVLCINSFAQETLQSVTDRGNRTTSGLELNIPALNSNKYLFLGGNTGYARIGAYDPTIGFDNLIIDAAKIGIGTTNPKAALDISKYILNGALGAVLGRLPEGDDTGNGTFLGIQGYNTIVDEKSFSIVHNFYGQTNSAINFHRGGDRIGGFISFSTFSNQERMRIDPYGNVGIGTVNPTEKLAVNGKIRAKEIKVEASNWPDYVFEEGYKVETLAALESYIKANKRLPEMPAAKEIETNGLALGEVLKLQQKKIEELTLHLIEKDKELRNIAAKQKEMETLLKKLTENK